MALNSSVAVNFRLTFARDEAACLGSMSTDSMRFPIVAAVEATFGLLHEFENLVWFGVDIWVRIVYYTNRLIN